MSFKKTNRSRKQKAVPEAIREEAHSFIHRVEYSDEGGWCALPVMGAQSRLEKDSSVMGPAGQAPLCTQHQVLRHWHTPSRLHREHGTASQEHLVNTCVHITNKGREGRKSGQAFFHQSNPINQITRDSMQGLWHLMETPTFTTRHICTENPPKRQFSG